MTAATARFFIFIFATGLFLLQASLHAYLFSFTPLIILVPVMATWGSDRPLLWIVPWLVCGELLSTSAPGTVTLVALMAILLRWVFRSVTTDVSFSFAGALGITIAGQMVILSILQTLSTAHLAIPWLLYIEILLSCTVLSFVVCNIWMQIKPLYD